MKLTEITTANLSVALIGAAAVRDKLSDDIGKDVADTLNLGYDYDREKIAEHIADLIRKLREFI